MRKVIGSSGSLVAACFFSLCAAVVPAALSINLLLVLRGHVADIEGNASGAHMALEVLDIASNVLPTFTAIAFELSDDERAQVLRSTDRQFARLEQAAIDLLSNQSLILSQDSRAKLLGTVERIQHNWAELRNDTHQEMTEFEKGYHIINIMDQLRLAREVLEPIRAHADTAAKRAADSSFHSIEQTTALLSGVLIASIVAGIIAISGAFYFARSLHRSNEDLQAALAQAKIADHTKSEFLANMSHEIRTPMNGVIGIAELLAATALNERQGKFVEIIRSSARSLLNIINDILDFSKIDAGQLVLDMQPFQLVQIADEPAQLVAPLAERNGLELLVRVQPGLPRTVIGDLHRIRQVVTNLAGNAVKFTEAGQVVIDVSGEERVEGGRAMLSLRVEVRDTGFGIAAHDQAHIFDKFRQLDGSSTRRHQGTGLGLSICKGLIEAMAGEIGVNYEPGKGSSFWFTVALPVAADAKPAAEVPIGLAGKCALVVDENATGQAILREVLGTWQIETVCAASGAKAVRLAGSMVARARPLDLVILDRHLPDMGAADVICQIRASLETAATPVILLNRLEEPDTIGTKPVADLLASTVKPVTASALLDAICKVLAPAALGPQADAEPAESPPPFLAQSDTVGDILLVEDNDVNRFVAQQTIAATGFRHVSASNGLEAVTCFERKQPCAILMDVSMPVMDGYQATRRIRAIETDKGLPRTPIIGLTAHALQGDREKCLAAGMDDHVAKPISVADLTKLIETWAKSGPTGGFAVSEAHAPPSQPQRVAAE